ncbi:RNA polymerase sigma factor [Myxococcota bacterium]|nr:RNA polymerase sigma factor [Myxococcota bacterium]
MSAAAIERSEKDLGIKSPKAERTIGDDELVSRIVQGDEAAFNLLYDRYFKRVYGFVHRRMSITADVEEVTQEVFINVFAGLASFRGEAPLSAWVFGVCRRVIASRFKRKRHPTVPLLSENGETLSHACTKPNPLEQYEYTERFEQIRESMNRRLNPEQRTLVRMHHIENQPIGEIARQLHKSEDAIKSNLYRARRLLISR